MGWLDGILGRLRPSPADAVDEQQLWTLACEALEAGRNGEAVKLGQQARRAEARRHGYEWDRTFANPEYSVGEAAAMLSGGKIRDHLEGISRQEEQVLRRLLATSIFMGVGVEEAGRTIRGLFWSGNWVWSDLETWRSQFTKLGRWPHMWDSRIREKPERTDRVARFSEQILTLSPEARAVLGVRSRPWHEIQSDKAGRDLFHWPEPAWTAARTEIEKLSVWREPTLDDVLAVTVPELKIYGRTLKLPVNGAKAALQNRLRSVGIDRLREALPEVFAPAKRLPWGKGDADMDSWIGYHSEEATLFAHRILVSSPEKKQRELDRYRSEGVVRGVRISAVEDPICEDLNGKGFLFSRMPRSLAKLPPHYPGCRCCLIPVTKPWENLPGDKAKGIQETGIEKGTDWLD